MIRGGSWDGLEDRDSIGEAIDAIEHQAMEMNIEIGRGAKPLDERHRAGLRLGFGKKGTDLIIENNSLFLSPHYEASVINLAGSRIKINLSPFLRSRGQGRVE